MAMAIDALQEEARFPVGYRFSPLDEELIVFYLKNHASPNLLSKAVHEIVDFDSFAPWILQDLYSLKRVDACYFLTHRKYRGDKAKDKIKTDEWRPTGKDQFDDHVGGVHKTYTYHKWVNNTLHMTNWKMVEYRLGELGHHNKRSRMEFQRVLCKIYKKHEGGKPAGDSHCKDLVLPAMHQDAIGAASHQNSFSHLDKFSYLDYYYHQLLDSIGETEGRDMQCSKLEEESLPIGVRFQPTDQEIISYILMKKPCKQPKVIHEVDVYEFDPWTLQSMYPMSRVSESYFITSRSRRYARGCRPKRNTGGGVWKSTSGDDDIFDKCGNPVGGVCKSFVYLKGTEKQKTNWLMKEYRLGGSGEKKLNGMNPKEWNPLMLDGVVVCKLYENKTTKHPSGAKDDDAEVEENVEYVGGTFPREISTTDAYFPGNDDDFLYRGLVMDLPPI